MPTYPGQTSPYEKPERVTVDTTISSRDNITPSALPTTEATPKVESTITPTPTPTPQVKVEEKIEAKPAPMDFSFAQRRELELANERRQAGQATDTDISNLKYAEDRGWSPVGRQVEQPPLVSDTPTPGAPTVTKLPGAPEEPAVPEFEGRPEDSNLSKLTSALNRGYYDINDISNLTGLDQDTVRKEMMSNYNLSYLQQENEISSRLDEEYVNYKTKMANLDNGIFNLTESEKAQIKEVEKMFDKMRQAQIIANKNYEGTIQTGEIRSGRQEFMNQTSAGIYKQAVDDGLDKIEELEIKAIAKVSELKDLFRDKRYKEVAKAYEDLTGYLNSKSEQISKINTATRELYNDIAAKEEADYERYKDEVANQFKYIQSELDLNKYLLEVAKFDETQAKNAAEQVIANEKLSLEQKKYALDELNKNRGYELDVQKYLLDMEKAKAQDTPANREEWLSMGGDSSGRTYQEFLLNKGRTSDKPPTADQSKNSGFAIRVNDSNNIITRLTKRFSELPTYKQYWESGENVPAWAKSSEAQQWEQAQRDFVNAVLRRESGAAIAPSEFESARKQYFPQPGENDAVIEQKKRNRENALKGLVMSAGTALSDDFKNNIGKIRYNNLQEYIDDNTDKADYIKSIKDTYPSWSPDEVLQFLQAEESPTSFRQVDSDTKAAGNIQLGSRLARVNNNPGNLRYVGQKGASQGEGGFARFPTPEAGYQALKSQIKLDASRGLTLNQFINKYAPPVENDTNLYVKQMMAETGANENTPVKNIDINKLARAMARKESSTIIS